ncbi:MAG: hypothetical protein Q9209_002197 [Squamulea sp. 1 TL-2023]
MARYQVYGVEPACRDSLSPWSAVGIHMVAEEEINDVLNLIYQKYPHSKPESMLPLWKITKPYQAPADYFNRMDLAEHVFMISPKQTFPYPEYYIGMEKLNLVILSQHAKTVEGPTTLKRKTMEGFEMDSAVMKRFRAGDNKQRADNGKPTKKVRFANAGQTGRITNIVPKLEEIVEAGFRVPYHAPMVEESDNTTYRNVYAEWPGERGMADFASMDASHDRILRVGGTPQWMQRRGTNIDEREEAQVNLEHSRGMNIPKRHAGY